MERHLLLVCTAVVALHSLVIFCNYMQEEVSIAWSIKNTFKTTISSPHAQQCDSMYLNLLETRGVVKNTVATAFVREFFETEWCDDIYNMSDHRQEYTERINDNNYYNDDDSRSSSSSSSRMERVFNFTSNERDELIAAQAVIHFHHWHESHLIDALTQTSRTWYTLTSHIKQMMLLVLVGGYNGMHMALNSLQYTDLKKKNSKWDNLYSA